MTRILTNKAQIISIIILFLLLCGQIYGWQGRRQMNDSALTDAEREIAAELAAQAIDRYGLRTTGPLYLVRVEWYRDKNAEEQGDIDRKAIVTHYRYKGDLAIITTVNLSKQEIMEVDSIPHLPTPLSKEEFNIAKDMALSDFKVEKALAAYRDQIEVEALVTRTTSTEDSLFAHRVVRLFFRVGRDYLSKPIVYVDLTSEKVIIEVFESAEDRNPAIGSWPTPEQPKQ